MVEETLQDEETVESAEDLFNQMYGDEPTPNDISVDQDIADLDKDPEPQAQDPVPVEGKPVEDPKPQPTEQQAAPDDPYAWIDALPQEYKDSAQKLRHQAQSDSGRVSALSRKVNEMQTALEAQAARATAVPEVTKPEPAAQEPSDALRQLKEDYPELGSQLDAIFAAERAQAEALIDSRLQPLQEKVQADAKASETAFLEAEAAKIFNTEETGVHWKDVVTSEDFSAWIEQQPTFIQNTARNTSSASEGLEIMRMYEDAYQAAVKATQQAEPVADTPDEETAQSDKLKASRESRKDTTISPESRPASPDSDNMSGDAESMFNAMWGNKKPSRRY